MYYFSKQSSLKAAPQSWTTTTQERTSGAIEICDVTHLDNEVGYDPVHFCVLVVKGLLLKKVTSCNKIPFYTMTSRCPPLHARIIATVSPLWQRRISSNKV